MHSSPSTKRLLLFAIGVVLSVGSVAIAAERPNILILFTDDQGYADLGCFGNQKNKTPRLDQLAKEGTRFTSFYAQTVCGPSRSALLTGRHPIRSRGWSMPASEITFAELARSRLSNRLLRQMGCLEPPGDCRADAERPRVR